MLEKTIAMIQTQKVTEAIDRNTQEVKRLADSLQWIVDTMKAAAEEDKKRHTK